MDLKAFEPGYIQGEPKSDNVPTGVVPKRSPPTMWNPRHPQTVTAGYGRSEIIDAALKEHIASVAERIDQKVYDDIVREFSAAPDMKYTLTGLSADGDWPEGFEELGDVLESVMIQASEGKGQERHANDKAWLDQPWVDITDQVGTGFLYGQALKKIRESLSFTPERRAHELLGAIHYLAMGIHYEKYAAEDASE